MLKIIMQFLETPVCIKEEIFSVGKNHIAINILLVSSSEYKTKFLFRRTSISTVNKRTFFQEIKLEQTKFTEQNSICLTLYLHPLNQLAN